MYNSTLLAKRNTLMNSHVSYGSYDAETEQGKHELTINNQRTTSYDPRTESYHRCSHQDRTYQGAYRDFDCPPRLAEVDRPTDFPTGTPEAFSTSDFRIFSAAAFTVELEPPRFGFRAASRSALTSSITCATASALISGFRRSHSSRIRVSTNCCNWLVPRNSIISSTIADSTGFSLSVRVVRSLICRRCYAPEPPTVNRDSFPKIVLASRATNKRPFWNHDES